MNPRLRARVAVRLTAILDEGFVERTGPVAWSDHRDAFVFYQPLMVGNLREVFLGHGIPDALSRARRMRARALAPQRREGRLAALQELKEVMGIVGEGVRILPPILGSLISP